MEEVEGEQLLTESGFSPEKPANIPIVMSESISAISKKGSNLIKSKSGQTFDPDRRGHSNISLYYNQNAMSILSPN